MNYSENKIKENADIINEIYLRNTDKEIAVLRNANIYECNKAVALICKDSKYKDWYGVTNKSCYKSWNEVQAFLDGLCVGKYAEFNERGAR